VVVVVVGEEMIERGGDEAVLRGDVNADAEDMLSCVAFVITAATFCLTNPTSSSGRIYLRLAVRCIADDVRIRYLLGYQQLV
jgi:hypothetical protein